MVIRHLSLVVDHWSLIVGHWSLVVCRFGARAVTRSVICACLTLTLIASCNVLAAQQVVDQIMTLVNNEIITRTDLLWSLAMDPNAPNPAGVVDSDTMKQKLEVMIDERLISQEAARIPGTEVSQEEIAKKRAELIKRFPNESVFRQRVESTGLTAERIDKLLAQRVLIDKFIDFRFRSFAFVSDQDVKKYYDEKIAPDIRAKGQVPPSLDEVKSRVTEVLKAEKIEQEIDRWLREARQRADIVQLAEP
ncbi:MAG: hypothetical protein DMF61_02845 [Blastocatellia bacterium AA13]|nr:MAG: hypothetical protein DMF61_02845 [Blastocatellia bacterium AA13]